MFVIKIAISLWNKVHDINESLHERDEFIAMLSKIKMNIDVCCPTNSW